MDLDNNSIRTQLGFTNDAGQSAANAGDMNSYAIAKAIFCGLKLIALAIIYSANVSKKSE